MRWNTNVVGPKNLRRNCARFGFRYFDYVVTVQKAKAQDRDVNIRPQEYKMRGLLYHRVGYRRFSRHALCFLSVLSLKITIDPAGVIATQL